DADVVAAAYPQRLIVDFIQNIQDGPDGPVRFSNFAPLGSNLLVAAYSNGFSGVIRVLRRDGTVAFEPATLFSGIVPKVDIVNLDGVAGDEVIVSFSSPRGHDS